MKTDVFTIIVCEIYHDPQDLLNALVYNLHQYYIQMNGIYLLRNTVKPFLYISLYQNE